MNALHALILGIVEGATEFLPVSSTGHMVLASSLLGLSETEFLKTFEIAIQFGAIAAVVAAFPRRLFMDLAVIKRLVVAFIPTAVIGFALYKLIKAYLLGNAAVVVWALAVGGAVIIAFERWHVEKPGAVTDLARIGYGQAALIGVAQSLAVVPGVSRSAATIIGGMALGISRAAIVEFSFLLAVPTILAAAGYDLLKSGSAIPPGGAALLVIGTVTAFAVALASIRFFMRFVSTRTLAPFGAYRLFAAAAMAFLLLR